MNKILKTIPKSYYYSHNRALLSSDAVKIGKKSQSKRHIEAFDSHILFFKVEFIVIKFN